MKICPTCNQPINPEKLHSCKPSDLLPPGTVLEREWAKMNLPHDKRQEIRDSFNFEMEGLN